MNKKNSKNKMNTKDMRGRSNNINTRFRRRNLVNNTQKYNQSAKI